MNNPAPSSYRSYIFWITVLSLGYAVHVVRTAFMFKYFADHYGHGAIVFINDVDHWSLVGLVIGILIPPIGGIMGWVWWWAPSWLST